MKPLFSIITVSFNSEKTIERTIKSILNQTDQDFEYLIIDGGSSDGTLDIIKKFEGQFGEKLRWISEPDFGIYNAMNKGIGKANGVIVGIVNSDDWLETNALKDVRDAFNGNNKSIDSIYCGWINFVSDNHTPVILKTDYNRFKAKASNRYTMDGIRHPAVFVPQNIYNKYGTFDESIRISADSDFILRLYFASVNFIFIEKPLSNMSDGGVSNNSKKKSIRKRCYQDYCVRLAKYDISYPKRIYLQTLFRIKNRIKGFIPSAMVTFVRSLKN
ncbi:MAG: glycosyltransferase [Muribaculaceae bacterium]|nr:glycosyltransferase [Muribaculaceae bacterium]